MSLQIGIVGLPNVGKSTLFNALIRAKKAEIANYPFCTIDPNVGVVEVPDIRIKKLAEIVNPAKIVPAVIEFIDIAGLVKNASKGEGLGNKFLANIRECDAICHLIRMFDDPDITHISKEIYPKDDLEIIHTELIIKDMETVEKRVNEIEKKAEMGDKELKKILEPLIKIREILNKGKLAVNAELPENEKHLVKDLNLLTLKPFVFAVNLSENEVFGFDEPKVKKDLGLDNKDVLIPVSAKIEQELIDLPKKEAKEYLNSLGLKETGLNRLIHASYQRLNLITYFTAGPKEVHAWTIQKGDTAPKAAGKIHSDFQKGFIKAEVVSYEDYTKSGGELYAKEKGLGRTEGKNYIVQDGDVIVFKFNN